MQIPLNIAMISFSFGTAHLRSTASQNPMQNPYDPLQGKVVPVFLRYAIPSLIGLLSVSSASLVDAIFLGNYVGAHALAAVNLSMPAISLLYALVFMLAVGGSVIAGSHLGKKDDHAAADVFTRIMLVSSITSLALLVIGLLFIDHLVSLLGANAELHPLVLDYLRIMLLFSPSLAIGVTLYYFVVIDGRPVLASSALTASAALNILLDWLLVVELEQGVIGAAWASGIAQVAVMLILLPHLFSKQAKLKLVHLQGSWHSLRHAAINGFSEFTNELSVGIITLIFNWIMVSRLGTSGVAAFSIVEYLLFIGVMVAYGFSESLQPIISKNLGAQQTDRIGAFLRTAMGFSLLIGLFFASLLLLVPDALIALFLKPDEDATTIIARDFIALFWPAFLFNGMNITLSSYFTSMHQPLPSAIIAILRSLALPALLLSTLPIWMGDSGVYIAVPIAEAITFAVALLLLYRYRRR